MTTYVERILAQNLTVVAYIESRGHVSEYYNDQDNKYNEELSNFFDNPWTWNNEPRQESVIFRNMETGYVECAPYFSYIAKMSDGSYKLFEHHELKLMKVWKGTGNGNVVKVA